MMKFLRFVGVVGVALAFATGARSAETDASKAPSGQKGRIIEFSVDWSRGLPVGPNGPIPAIVIDQFGYPTKSRKVAVIRAPQMGYDSVATYAPGPKIALVDASTRQIVKEAAPLAWNGGAMHEASGDRAWWFDFSEIELPGRYLVLDIDKGIRSADFSIGDGVYRDVMKHALRTFFYQRAGFEKKAEFAGADWADRASHLGPGQDAESSPWPSSRPPTGRMTDPAIRDLRGGWYDAGDFNKYTSWTARNIIVLLRAFDENPQAFGDNLGIPESGNGVPDLLDEVKWGLDWMIRMQNADGSVLCIQALANGSPPSAAKGQSFYGPATTSATLMGAAVFAYAAKVYGLRNEEPFKQYAAELTRRAKAAWDWARANPGFLYWNNDDWKQPGSKGLANGQQEMNDEDRFRARLEAAIYLYELTRDPSYKQFVESNYMQTLSEWGPSMWEADAQEAVLYFARLDGVAKDVKDQILARFLSRVGPGTESFFQDIDRNDPYRAPMKDYTWGSNRGKAFQARLYQLVGLYAQVPVIRDMGNEAASEYVHYIHGVNPVGLVYLTNMSVTNARHSASVMYHAWFVQGSRWEKVQKGQPGPPPGYLVGGPSSQFGLDGCCSAAPPPGGFRCSSRPAAEMCERSYAPPLGQPPMKAYLQSADGWPIGFWQITEPSTSYQAYYIRLLASFVH